MDNVILNEKKQYLAIYILGVVAIVAFMYYFFGLSSAFAINSIVSIFVFLAMIIDIKEYIIPDEIIVAMTILGLITYPINPYTTVLSSLIGFVGFGGIMMFLSKISEGQVGMGDAKLLAVLGIWLGFKSCFMVFLYALILGGLYGMLLMVVRRITKKTEIPFVPFVMMGIVIEMFMKF